MTTSITPMPDANTQAMLDSLRHAVAKTLERIGESLFLRKLLWASLPNKRQKLRDR
jgi:hypothetical protein